MSINYHLSRYNKLRCESKKGFNHKLDSWSLSDWITATLGELGEAANIVKKLNRHRDGINEKIPEEELKQMLADELADTYIYLDLLFQAAGINIEEAVNRKFEETSLKIGYIEDYECVYLTDEEICKITGKDKVG